MTSLRWSWGSAERRLEEGVREVWDPRKTAWVGEAVSMLDFLLRWHCYLHLTMLDRRQHGSERRL
jgi:hypothetical protein